MYDETIVETIKNTVNIVDYILQYTEIENIDVVQNECLCPIHDDNVKSMVINSEQQLFNCFFCGGGDVITFVQKYHKLSFTKAIDELIRWSKLDPNNMPKTPEIINYLKKEKKRVARDKPDFSREILDPKILNSYSTIDDTNLWTSEESIPMDILNDYGIKFDMVTNRLVYPIYDFQGQLINIKGRTLNRNYKSLGIRKYTYYYPVGVLDFLFAFDRKKKIEKCREEMILFESAKSVMKLDSFGMENSISMETNKLSREQEELLLTFSPRNVIIALDENEQLKKIKENFRRLARFLNVYIIYDFDGILKTKNSPIDQGIDDFMQLYNKRIRL